jgi:hypothetical protein
VNVVRVVRQGEGGAAEVEQRDELLGPELLRKEEDPPIHSARKRVSASTLLASLPAHLGKERQLVVTLPGALVEPRLRGSRAPTCLLATVAAFTLLFWWVRFDPGQSLRG